MLWWRGNQKGMEGCRQTESAGQQRKECFPSEWHRNSGCQSGTVSVSYFRRLSDKLWDCEMLLLALIPLFQPYEWAASPPAPQGLESLCHVRAQAWQTLDLLYGSFFPPPVQTITVSVVYHETVVKTAWEKKEKEIKSLHENRKSVLPLFPQAS